MPEQHAPVCWRSVLRSKECVRICVFPRYPASSCWCGGLWIIAALFPAQSQADTVDIGVQLFRDPLCYESAGEALLTENVCYANSYTNQTFGLKFRIVHFDPPALIYMWNFLDECKTQDGLLKTITAQRCTEYTGSLWCKMSLRERSNVYVGPDCSTMQLGVQNFYAATTCSGPTVNTFSYPIQGECLAASQTGSVEFQLSGPNLTRRDYIGNKKCLVPSNLTIVESTSSTIGRCYPLPLQGSRRWQLRPPRSFRWSVEKGKVAVVSNAFSRRRSSAGFLVALLAASVFGVTAAVPSAWTVHVLLPWR